MPSYGPTERAVARLLEKTPAVKQFVKNTYQQVQFILHRESGFRCAVDPRIRIRSAIASRGVTTQAHHFFFGYYDKAPWNEDQSLMLMHAVRDEAVEIVAVNHSEQQVTVFGETLTWNWQQGAMAQWVPGTDQSVAAYNSVQDGCLGAVFFELDHLGSRFIPWPIQTMHPDGNVYLALNYKLLHRLRPEYGYAPDVSNFSSDMPLDKEGFWRMDLIAGDADLIISLEQLCNTHPRIEFAHSEHKVNHAMYSPKGSRFVFMHRWFGPEGKNSRLYVAESTGENLRLLLDDRMVSHYCWRDEDHVLAWARKREAGDHYYLINVHDGTWEIIGEGVLDQYGDGHPSYSPDRRWIITDTYPDKARQRRLLLFDTETDDLTEVGRFFAPWRFDGGTRCDLHPRWSPDGTMISIDSAHEGIRRSYVLDVRQLVCE